MNIYLHLLGGGGRIGTAIIESIAQRAKSKVKSINIYCDSTKIEELKKRITTNTKVEYQYKGYSEFNHDLTGLGYGCTVKNKNVVLNLRGINDKKKWLNEPLTALDLQIESCKTITESNLWMVPGVEIIHFSSQLCEIIEQPVSIEQMCEGQESYRRPYMISRMHQEAMLTAYAYKHGIKTNLIRLPAIYGFQDDKKSPWVLNSLCNQLLKEGVVKPRNPNREINITHREKLIKYVMDIIEPGEERVIGGTVNYLSPPMIKMQVQTLASLIESNKKINSKIDEIGGKIELIDESCLTHEDKKSHLDLLNQTITSLL
tara:strand:- start:681 stop:1628 length:948 start_codon:yes stop_codon:yes gene_type:complete